MTDKEAMKQALEHLDRVMSHGSAVQEAKDILREQLTQPKQEPVSGVVLDRHGSGALVKNGSEDWHCKNRNARRLYTTPPQGIYYTPPQRKPEQEMRDVLKLAQDALQMASAPFPVDEVKTLRALQAVNKLLQEMEQP